MRLALFYYLAIILIIRLVFYFLPRHRTLTGYGIRAVFEVGAVWLLLDTDGVAYGVLTALMVLLCMFSYVLEAKLTDTRAAAQSQGCRDPVLYVGLALYLASISLVFFGGQDIAVRPELFGWLPRGRSAAVVFFGAVLALAESRHIVGYVARKLRTAAMSDASPLAAEHVTGLCERLLMYALVVLAQFPAMAVIVLGRTILTALPGRSAEAARSDLAGALFSLTLAFGIAIVVRLVAF